MKLLLALLLALSAAPHLPAQDPQVKMIRERFAAARPTAQQLAFYSLDWAPSLAEAKARARREGRPILFIWLTNISAPTDFFSGHC